MSTPAQPITNASAPDLSGLSQPGPNAAPATTAPVQPAAPPDPNSAVQSQIAPFAAKQQSELQAAADAEKVSTTPNVGSHQKLFNIISAIGTGLSAAGASIGSGGKLGGAEYVENINAQQQQQK